MKDRLSSKESLQMVKGLTSKNESVLRVKRANLVVISLLRVVMFDTSNCQLFLKRRKWFRFLVLKEKQQVKRTAMPRTKIS